MAHDGACGVAETLLAVTLSAISSVDAGDWETAGNLLRRRDQLLTQLENCSDLKSALKILGKVQEAERELADAMEIATREALMDLSANRDARLAQKAYGQRPRTASLIERVG